MTDRQQRIMHMVALHRQVSISGLKALLQDDISQPTLNRDLATLVRERTLVKSGKAASPSVALSVVLMARLFL